MDNFLHNIGIVVIGRNEGARLNACFESISSYAHNTVYVDSGSTDSSVQVAESHGIDVVNLDMSIPFSAARARNEGANHLLSSRDDIKFIQFIDGDCTVDPDWIDFGLKSFENDIAVVCGRRKEKYPEASKYNQLCDIEWNTPIGLSNACGGDCIIKADVFMEHSGYNPSVIAGEEPELCYRLRKSGYKILRVDHAMTYHDANIHSFKPHWMRSVRAGYAYALGLYMHNESHERHYFKQNLSALFWGLCLPLVVLLLAYVTPYFLLILLIYPLNILKIYIRVRNQIPIPRIYASSLVIGKFSEAFGILKFTRNLLLSKKHTIIEYK